MKSLSLATPHLLVMVGIPGSGKSFFAEKFSDTFNAPFVSYHTIASLAESNAQEIGDYMITELMKSHQSLLVEGRSDTRRERMELAKLARVHGYEPLYIWVQVDAETAQNRAARPGKDKSNRIMEASDHEQLVKRFAPLTAGEKSVVISGKHTYASQAKVVLRKLSEAHVAETKTVHPPSRPNRPDTGLSGRHNISIG
ncbi:MAG TPA: AAA family ATPase [Candidatus Saccharimonadaceae bacterium]|nr:AAA family ATPase [Candidatus Saccharimonadaceae bacterium]